MPEHIIAIGAALVLCVTCISIAIELIAKPQLTIKLSGSMLIVVAVCAAISAASRAGLPWLSLEQQTTLLSISVGITGYILLLALNLKPRHYSVNWLWLLLLFSLSGYAFNIALISYFSLVSGFIIIAAGLIRNKIHAYHFYTASVLLGLCIVLLLIPHSKQSNIQVIYHMLMAGTLYQYYRHYCYTIRL
ncbi:hypothetical protein [Neptunicella marina]|uniref:Uncharacterized protein n=1 Tax=Neptunicella marina TaxID=2125989 RepID=A0A8J6M084_9ALTE|nr:hypothetical protein [Neptunicella marina]MBC3764393.1 hypothetical protein [Neptunicella marina]